jgi:hypothetical protein
MASALSDQLKTARLRQFVGREAECALFQSALTADELPFFVVYVFGPGGVGKTFLLKQFASIAESHSALAIYLDGRNFEPAPGGFLNAVHSAAQAQLGQPATPSNGTEPSLKELWPWLNIAGKRCVMLVDTYEMLAPLDGWLREEFLPAMPDNVVLVLAGRQAPSPAWRADPVWQTLIHAIPLRNLDPEESRVFLAQRSVPEQQHQAVLSFTHGHPLALSLVADTFAQRGSATGSFQPEETPDVIKALLERFVQKVPSPAHRAALEACAIVRTLTEDVLCSMLAAEDVHELFEWLRELSFVDSGRFGLFPHDLAREAISADLRWRNPDWYTELHKRARAYYNNRLQTTPAGEQPRILFDFSYLHRDNAIVRQYMDWQESGSMRVETAREVDFPELIEMVVRHEGEESADYANHWFQRQPEGVLVLRDVRGITGFLLRIQLNEASAEDLQADPIAQKAWNYVRTHAPVRQGELATLFRHWMARDTYQQVSPAQTLVFISVVQHYLTAPRLAVSIFTAENPDFWELLMAYADLERITEGEYELTGRKFGMFAHDWRVTTPAVWLDLLAERETAINPPSFSKPKPTTQLIALSEPDFAAAVRDALRQMSRSHTLRGNALLGSRLVIERVGQNASENDRINTLKKLISEAVDALQGTPRDMKLYRALYHTYIRPAASQEQAAEVLDLPFSTYRRHLQAGIERITDTLWHKELGE